MNRTNLTLDRLIDIYVRGVTVDQLRDEVANAAYPSMMGEDMRTLGITGQGSKTAHDDQMIAIASRIPRRYANDIIDQVNGGFCDLKTARPLRYETVILSHISTKPRSQQALQLGLTLNQYKNELSLGREYLSVRFVSLLLSENEQKAG